MIQNNNTLFVKCLFKLIIPILILCCIDIDFSTNKRHHNLEIAQGLTNRVVEALDATIRLQSLHTITS